MDSVPARTTARMGTYLYHEFIAINNTFNQPITPREIARAKKSSYSAQTKDACISLARNPSLLQGSTELLVHVPASHVEAGIFCGRFVSLQHEIAKLRIVDV